MNGSNGAVTCEDGPRQGRSLPSFADMSSQQRSLSMDATVRQVAALSAHHNRMAETIKAQGDEIETLKVRTASAELHMARFTCMPFLARLRWLLTGR